MLSRLYISLRKQMYLTDVNAFQQIGTIYMHGMFGYIKGGHTQASKQLHRTRANLRSCLFRAVIPVCDRGMQYRHRGVNPLSICVAQESPLTAIGVTPASSREEFCIKSLPVLPSSGRMERFLLAGKGRNSVAEPRQS